ncbi:UNVERIFIED_CONTAM: hypothetical protein FKN15_012921 [Acipenser sinensis]
MPQTMSNPYAHLVEPLDPQKPENKFYNLCKLGDPRYGRLPFSIRVLLEAAVRNCDEFLVKKEDVESILNWKVTQQQSVEVPFRPARVILQDFTLVQQRTGSCSVTAWKCQKHLRQIGVVGKFVEFFGPGVARLSIADRATIANMCPEYGATAAFFPVDHISIKYLEQTGRDKDKLSYITGYLKAVGMFRDFSNSSQDPDFTQVVELDLSTVVPCCSGPKRPQDKVVVSEMKKDFESCLGAKQGFKGFQIAPERHAAKVNFKYDGQEFVLSHGSVVIAAITSCTNTSNPSVMLGAGLLAKKAIEAGLSVKPYVKTSLSPGSGVVTYYLKESGVMPFLSQLGYLYYIVNERWNALKAPSDELYTWDPKSTYIKSPPFFESLGIRAVLAESYERIHRSNLVGMGVIPLEYLPEDTAESLGLTGQERYTIIIPDELTPRMIVDIKLDTGKTIKARMRFDTDVELAYFHNGGILNYMIRKMLEK